MSDTREMLVTRFKRYLHYGAEQPLYKAGDRFKSNCYTKESIPSLLKLIDEEESEKIIDIILKVAKEETSSYPEALIYALVTCCEQVKNIPLQCAAYKTVRAICKHPKDIILFVKFYRDMKKNSEGNRVDLYKFLGGGNGFKRAVAEWYLVWMPFDLVDIFLNQKSYYGWSHTDVLRVAHVKPVSIEQNLLMAYAARGYKEAEKKHGSSQNDQVVELLEYINTVENFRKIKDPVKAAKAIREELHPLERVPSCLLKHQEVWNELIPHLDVKTLLENLQRLSIMGFLKQNNLTVMKVVDVFNNVYKAESYKGHPSRVFIEIMTYEKAATYCIDIATKMNHESIKITPSKKPPKVNPLIRNALQSFFYNLYKYRKPTGLRYLVVVDLRAKMMSDRCHHCMHLSPLEAAEVVALSLVRTEAEKAVTVCAFMDAKGDLQELPFTKDSDIPFYDQTFKEKSPNAGPASVAAAIHWAQTNKKQFDVFVTLSNYMVMTAGTRHAIHAYRTAMNLPDSKVITCSLSGSIRKHKDVEGQNMICVVGFDEQVCRIIESFAKGAF